MEEYFVGDEVMYRGKRFIVTRHTDNSLIYVLGLEGITLSFDYPSLRDGDCLVKTGRSYPAIIEILTKLGEPT